MLLWCWAVVAALCILWISPTHAACPTTEEQAKKAGDIFKKEDKDKAIKLTKATILAATAATSIAAAATGVGAVTVPILAGIGGLATFAVDLTDLFFPKGCPPLDPQISEVQKELAKILPAINELKNLILEKFEEINRTIKEAVNEIELHAELIEWKREVSNKMERYREYTTDYYASNFSRVRAEQLGELCRDNNFKPYAIAVSIWSMFGAGCENENVVSTTILGAHCDFNDPYYSGPCEERTDTCMAKKYIRAAGHAHNTGVYISEAIVDVMVELASYHGTCVGHAFNDSARIQSEIDDFAKKFQQILSQMPKIVNAEIEQYWQWPGAAQETIDGVLKHQDANADMDAVFKVLNEKFSWYRHDVLVYESLGEIQWKANVVIWNWAPHTAFMITRYRYVSDEDKTSLKTRTANYVAWLNTKMTGEYSVYTVKTFLEFLYNDPTGQTSGIQVCNVLRDHGGGECDAADRNSLYINLFARCNNKPCSIKRVAAGFQGTSECITDPGSGSPSGLSCTFILENARMKSLNAFVFSM